MPGSDTPARTPVLDLLVLAVVGCTKGMVVVVGLDTIGHTTVPASASANTLLLLPPDSAPQTDEATQRVSQKAQKAVREGMVLCSVVVDSHHHQGKAVDHVHVRPQDPECSPRKPKGG